MIRILRPVLALSALLTVVSTPAAPALADTSLGDSCPAYKTQLRTALELLKRGERAAAVAALRAAHDAIESCLREEGGETALAAAPGRGRTERSQSTTSAGFAGANPPPLRRFGVVTSLETEH